MRVGAADSWVSARKTCDRYIEAYPSLFKEGIQEGTLAAMTGFEQLNIFGLANLKSKVPQHIHLFDYDDFKAQLIVVPPGTTVAWHEHAALDEVMDVIEGEGVFAVADREFRGGPGKSVYVKAGVQHGLRNDSPSVWVVRSTCREHVTPRDIGKIMKRAIRARLNLDT